MTTWLISNETQQANECQAPAMIPFDEAYRIVMNSARVLDAENEGMKSAGLLEELI